MKRLNFSEVMEASFPSQLCVSIYLPHYRDLANFKEGDAQLQSVLKEVRDLSKSSDRQISSRVLDDVKKNAEKIRTLQKNHGVAWFSSEMTSGFIPTSWGKQAFAVVSDTFHVKPLFRDLQKSRPFFVLAVNSRHLKLFSRWENSLLLVERVAIHEEGSEVRQKDKSKLGQRQLVKVAELIQKHLSRSNDPLVLAGAQSILSRLKAEINYPYVLEDGIFCNADRISTKELFSSGYRIATRYFDAQEDQIISECVFCEKANKALTDIHEIGIAAVHGRVERLVIAEDHHVWGILDRKTGEIKVHEKQKSSSDDDILDDLSELVYRHKGSVWVVEKQKLGKTPIYATLRW